MRRVPLVAILILGAFSVLISISGWCSLVLVSIAAAAIAAAALRKDDFQLASAIFGAAIPLLNICGTGGLLLLALVYFAIAATRYDIALRCLFPWILFLAISTFADIYWSVSLTAQWSPQDALRAWHHFPPDWLTALLSTLRWFVFVLGISFFSRRKQLVSSVVRGVQIGFALSTLIVIYDFFAGIHSHQIEQNAFWTEVNRYSGTFTDANAFGLAAFLAFAFWRNEIFYFPVAAVMLSGSRSLLLGIFLLIITNLPLSRKHCVGGLIALLASYLIFISIPLAKYETFLTTMPHSVERAVRSVHPESAAEALSSRALFLRIGLQMWKENPLLGVGLARFRSSIPEYAARAGIPIGRWLDNSNNFYLGTLAELGLFGMAVLLAAACALRWQRVESVAGDERVIRWQRKILLIFLVLLLVGPHLDFDEVAILVALVVARAGVEIPEIKSFKYLSLGIVIFAPILVYARVNNQAGVFPLEHPPEGAFFWIEPSARMQVECDQEHHYLLRYRAPQPISAEVQLGDQTRTLNITNNEQQSLELPCSGQKQTLTIRCSSYFVPATNPASSDYRRLCMQLFPN